MSKHYQRILQDQWMGLFLKSLSCKGDIISLAALLWKVDFSTAVKGLLNLSEKQPLSFSFSGQTQSGGNGIEISSVSRLNHLRGCLLLIDVRYDT